MKKIEALAFFRQVKHEVGRVAWPDTKSVFVSLSLIVSVVFVVGIFVLSVDYMSYTFMHWVLNLGKV